MAQRIILLEGLYSVECQIFAMQVKSIKDSIKMVYIEMFQVGIC